MSLTRSELNRLNELVDAVACKTPLAPDQREWLEDLQRRLTNGREETSRDGPADGSLTTPEPFAAQYRHLIENQPDLICRFLADTTLTFVNQAYADFFQKRPEEIVGSKFIDLLAEEDRPTVLRMLSNFSPESPSKQYTHPTVSATGEQRWHLWHDYAFFDDSRRPIEFQSVGVDISDRKRIESGMESISSVFLALGKDFAADVARLTELCGGLLKADVAFYNRKMNGALFSYGMCQPPNGYDPQKPLQGQMCQSLLTKPDERCTAIHHLSRSRFAASNPDVLKFGFETYIGRPVFCRGEPAGVLCALFQDHVEFSPADEHFMALLAYALGEQEERSLALAEQRKLQAELALTQNIESVGRLAGGIAHDFNNQLTVIAGVAEMLQMNAKDSGTPREELDDILNAAKRATLLTRKLLGFARRQPIRPVALDLNETIHGMLPMLQQATGQVRLQWRPGADTWSVKIDPAQLDQILAPLLANAHDAAVPGGLVSIETANLTIAGDAQKPAVSLATGDYVVMRVIDNGQGIDPGLLEKVFEPFFTTKPGGVGTGLGLSAVYGIVKQNSGAVTVQSEPGQGATFTIYLPRHAPEPALAKSSRPAGVSPGRGERILVVEDEVGVLNLARRILEKSGYVVIPANGPTEALRLAEEWAGRIDLVLSDVMMPEMNGPALIERLLVERPDLKYIFMSGFTAGLIGKKGHIHQEHSFLQKPFSIETLTAAVQATLASGTPASGS